MYGPILEVDTLLYLQLAFVVVLNIKSIVLWETNIVKALSIRPGPSNKLRAEINNNLANVKWAASKT